LLRLRTSPEFQISAAYGHLVVDPSFSDVFHIQGCDVWKTFAFDFKFATPNGFDPHGREQRPAVQMAFAYTYLPGINEPNRHCVERRLRIHTVQLNSTFSLKTIYGSADAFTIISILIHKVNFIEHMKKVQNI
jgi:hypothetical protein